MIPAAPRRPRPVPSRRAAMAALVVAFLALAACASPPPAAARTAYLVVTRTGTEAPASVVRDTAPGAVVTNSLDAVDVAAVELTSSEVGALRKDPDVLAVEPDGVVEVQTDRPRPPSWGLDRIDQRSLPLDNRLSTAGDGDGVVVYVVDTGVAAHPDLGARLTAGFDAVTPGGTAADCHGHGTHVAGTAAGTRHGVAPAAQVVPVRVLNCSGSGSYSQVIAGLDWVVAHHQDGPAVLNMSLGGGASAAVDAATQRVIDDGVSVVVAAGNSRADACYASPARTPEALTVGATDRSDAKASYSNYGRCLDIFAPGTDITSAWLGGSTHTISGTSMATPHVAGAAAVVLGTHPHATPAEITSALTSSSTSSVKNPGTGSPNALLWLDPTGVFPIAPPAPVLPGPPGPPRSVSASGADAAATITWVAPRDGGSPITGYVVTSAGAEVCRTTETSCRVGGLTNGRSYTFAVTASNALGTSSPTRSNAVVPNPPPRVPSTPLSLAGVPSPVVYGTVNFTWWAPNDPGTSPVLSYRVEVRTTSGALASWCPATAPRVTCGVTGLTQGATYRATVTAANAAGTSQPSPHLDFTVPTKPGPPGPVRDLAASSDSRQLTATWSPPASTGGGARLSYTVSVTGGGVSRPTACVTDQTRCTVTGLQNNQRYNVSVVATTSAGRSAPVVLSSVLVTVAPSPPLAPPSPSARAILTGADLSWGAPTWPDTPVLGYTVRNAASGQVVCATAARSCRVTGLTPGVAATFEITARNVFGEGAAATTPPVTPLATATAPSPPTKAAVTYNRSVPVLSFDAPTSDGGSPVTAIGAVVMTSMGLTVAQPRFDHPTPLPPRPSLALTGLRRGAYLVAPVVCNAGGCSTGNIVAMQVR